MLVGKNKKMTAGLVAGLVLCGAQIGSVRAAETFILAHPMNTEHVFHAISERFSAEVQDKGDFKVRYHPAGDLGDWTSLFEQSMQGVVNMTMTWGASEFDERLDLSWLAYVVDNWEDAKRVYGPGGGMVDIYNEILHGLDLHLIGLIPTDFGSVVIRKGVGKVPTKFPEDGKGIKMRVPGVKIAVDRFTNWGFAAVPIPLSEVYTALQLGTVDGRSFSTAVETYNMRDVLETNVLTNDYFEASLWLVNKDWWDGLSDEDRAILQAAADASIDWAWGEAQKLSQEFLEKSAAAGVKNVELSAEELAAAKAIIYEKEWPYMESIVGSEIMAKLKAAAGIE